MSDMENIGLTAKLPISGYSDVGGNQVLGAKELFEDCLKNTLQVLFRGPPGVGKSVMVEDVCKELGYDLIPICTPLCTPEFISGYPFRHDGTAGHAPFGPIARALAATKPTCVIWDELGGGSESVLKALLRGMQFREFADRRLPDCVTMCGATNDVGHGAGVMGLLEPMKDRFQTIIEIEPSVESTVVYGLGHQWPASVLAFLRNSPDSLLDWKPVRSMASGGATPRGWGDIARMESIGLVDRFPQAVIGKVGLGSGAKYLAYRKLMSELPDLAEIQLNPDAAPVPENPGARYLVAMALAMRMDGHSFGPFLTYLKRLPMMFRAYSVKDAFRSEAARRSAGTLPQNWKPLKESPDFTPWVCSADWRAIEQAASGA